VLATASDKGTVIRVFGCPDGEKLYQFRRGSYPARITSLAFNHSAEFLAVGSDTETVHVFRCSAVKPTGKTVRSSWGSGSVTSEGPIEETNMDAVIEQKRRSGSMRSRYSPRY
jgi:autophagy-related protein 18